MQVTNTKEQEKENEMTLLDHFASQVLPSVFEQTIRLKGSQLANHQQMANESYKIAQAMLESRKRYQDPPREYKGKSVIE